MTGDEVAKILAIKLLKLGFIVHRYNSVMTSSIYLKLDFRCGLWHSHCRSSRKTKVSLQI